MAKSTVLEQACKLEANLKSFAEALSPSENDLREVLGSAAEALDKRFDLKAQRYHGRKSKSKTQISNPRRLQVSRNFFSKQSGQTTETVAVAPWGERAWQDPKNVADMDWSQ